MRKRNGFCRHESGLASIHSRTIRSHESFSLVGLRHNEALYTGGEREVINMGSYNYLGFSHKEGPCTQAAADQIGKNGLSGCSTRHDLGLFRIQQTLEERIADFLGVEAAICFPMGFGTNSTSLPTLANQNTLVLSDELNHSSLVLGLRISRATIRIFKHNDAEDLERKLQSALFSVDGKIRFDKILIVVEGIYSMEGTIVNLPAIIAIKKRYKAYLFIDEAHSIGALGPTGRGVVEYWRCNPKDVDILMGTLTKSFAGAGGYVAGSKDLIRHMRRNTAGSIYGSSMSAPIVAQVLRSMIIMSGDDHAIAGKRRNAILSRNTRYFRRRLRQLGFIVYGHDNSPVIPVLTFYIPKVVCFGRETLKRGLALVCVGYPATAIDRSRVRFCVSAEHTKEQLDRALAIADQVGSITGTKYLGPTNEAIEY
ncbi:aminotransferase class I and II domain-containing protein [Ditylenchus destructor]|uniref:Aminotransferase class I and II domain-containing protein n=1 Tax=Ditylenchus destructor TaxID=166010 RepID=A0AAD4RAL6_9BILA|nr:aminotransferase class I and II domain-containing protein [Ditylenchus destructor]